MNLDLLEKSHRARCAHLDHQQREVIARLFAERCYPKNGVILRRGDRSHVAFVVNRGTVQICTENEWGQTTVVDLGEGDVFGEEIVLGEAQSPYEATALENSELILLDRSDLDELAHWRRRFFWKS